MEFDREIDHYEVEVEDFVSSAGAYRHFETKNFGILEDAVAYARNREKKSQASLRVTVRMIENIVGWWEE